jgi:hypothetical protein
MDACRDSRTTLYCLTSQAFLWNINGILYVPIFLAFCRPKSSIMWRMPKSTTYCTVQSGPTWALASATFECSDGWPWGNEFQGDNSPGDLGKQRTSGFFSCKSLWKSWVTVAYNYNLNDLGGWDQVDHGLRTAGANSSQDPISKMTRAKLTVGVAQAA